MFTSVSKNPRGVILLCFLGSLSLALQNFVFLFTSEIVSSSGDKDFGEILIKAPLGNNSSLGLDHLSMAKGSQCPNREGVVVLNALGRLGNNVLQFAYGKLVSTQLCWPLIYRAMWQGPLAQDSKKSKGLKCFPNAKLGDGNFNNSNLSPSLLDKLDLTETKWSHYRKSNQEYEGYLKSLKSKGLILRINHEKPNAVRHSETTNPGTSLRLEIEATGVQLLSLQAFFLTSWWMLPEATYIREWFTIDDSCCNLTPPDDAVVIHIRDFGTEKKRLAAQDMNVSVYVQIMEEYNYTDRTLWIVCEPRTKESEQVKSLLSWHASLSSLSEVRVVTGDDAYDAMCILSRSKTLILSSESTFSQFGAFLAGPSAQVHYNLRTLNSPRQVLWIPSWKYHLVAGNSNDEVKQYDVPHDQIHFNRRGYGSSGYINKSSLPDDDDDDDDDDSNDDDSDDDDSDDEDDDRDDGATPRAAQARNARNLPGHG